MSIITRDIRAEWKTALQPYLQDADAQNLTIRIAGAQGLGTREWPTTQAELETILNCTERVCEEVIAPHVADEYDSENVIKELCSILESYLREELDRQQAKTQQDVPSLEDQLNRSRAKILRGGIDSFRLAVSQNIARELRYRSDATIASETVEALVVNLDHSQSLVRRAAARTLSEVAKQYPYRIRAHLNHICQWTSDDSTSIGCLETLLWVLDADPSFKEMTKISEAAGQSLRSQSEECQHTAADIHQQIVKKAPEAISSEVVDELLDMRVHPDPVLGEKIEFVLGILHREVGLTSHEYSPEKTFDQSPAPFCESSPHIPPVPNIDFDDEPSNAGLSMKPWTKDDDDGTERPAMGSSEAGDKFYPAGPIVDSQ